jgi:hypothetical protein
VKTSGLQTGICPKCQGRYVAVRKPDGGAVIRSHVCGTGLKARDVQPLPANRPLGAARSDLGRKS